MSPDVLSYIQNIYQCCQWPHSDPAADGAAGGRRPPPPRIPTRHLAPPAGCLRQPTTNRQPRRQPLLLLPDASVAGVAHPPAGARPLTRHRGLPLPAPPLATNRCRRGQALSRPRVPAPTCNRCRSSPTYTVSGSCRRPSSAACATGVHLRPVGGRGTACARCRPPRRPCLPVHAGFKIRPEKKESLSVFIMFMIEVGFQHF